jgi:hypothetical protein
LSIFRGLHSLGPAFDSDSLELFVQRQLLDQCLAKFGVVIDNQNCSLIGHRPKAFQARKRSACRTRGIEHSSLKEQAGTAI